MQADPSWFVAGMAAMLVQGGGFGHVAILGKAGVAGNGSASELAGALCAEASISSRKPGCIGTAATGAATKPRGQSCRLKVAGPLLPSLVSVKVSVLLVPRTTDLTVPQAWGSRGSRAG